MSESESEKPHSPQVFLCYSRSDRMVAERIAEALTESGTRVWFDQYAIEPGESLAEEIDRTLKAVDFVVVLLSRRSVESKWVQQELAAAYGREMETRAVTLVPVMLEDCHVPRALASKQFFDLRGNLDAGIQALAARLTEATKFDFSALSPRAFEGLVASLLSELGFRVELTPQTQDGGVDIIATHEGRDPLGSDHQVRYLVECKHYRHGRADLNSVRQLAGALARDKAASGGLLVTTGQFTSPVRDWVREHQLRLRLLDGTELVRLLIAHPEVARKHLARNPQ